MFVTHATYHTTTQATPAQLVFGRDAILNTKFDANWKKIRKRKQQITNKNNKKKKTTKEYLIGIMLETRFFIEWTLCQSTVRIHEWTLYNSAGKHQWHCTAQNGCCNHHS
jgi:uncharacterized protein with NRDE domain